MQTQSMKLLRTRTNQLLFFFYSNGNILLKKGTAQAFSSPEMIIEDVSPNFSVCLSSEDIPYILCSSNTGSIYFCRENHGKWDKKMLMESSIFHQASIKFYLFLERNQIHFIYSMPSEDGKQNYIMSLVCEDGKWGNPHKIDSFLPLRQSNFLIHEIEENHIVLYYKTKENGISSREMLLSPITLGTLNPIIQAGYPMLDFSFLTTRDKIHFISIIKGTFSSQLIYRNKYQAQFSSPIVLCEGQRMEHCLIFSLKNRIWIFWMNNGQMFYVTSDNEGRQFSTPAKYQGNISKKLVKAEYRSKINSELLCNEVFVDSETQNEILILPEIYLEFYGKYNKKQYTEKKTAKEDQENIEKLKNKLFQTEAALKEANNQIMQLTKDLSLRSNEISSVNVQWRGQWNTMKEELKKTEEKWKESQKKCEALEKALHQKEQELQTLRIQTKEVNEESQE